jgi:hypothetical protein
MLFPNFYVPSVGLKMANYETFPCEFIASGRPGTGFQSISCLVHTTGFFGPWVAHSDPGGMTILNSNRSGLETVGKAVQLSAGCRV